MSLATPPRRKTRYFVLVFVLLCFLVYNKYGSDSLHTRRITKPIDPSTHHHVYGNIGQDTNDGIHSLYGQNNPKVIHHPQPPQGGTVKFIFGNPPDPPQSSVHGEDDRPDDTNIPGLHTHNRPAVLLKDDPLQTHHEESQIRAMHPRSSHGRGDAQHTLDLETTTEQTVLLEKTTEIMTIPGDFPLDEITTPDTLQFPTDSIEDVEVASDDHSVTHSNEITLLLQKEMENITKLQHISDPFFSMKATAASIENFNVKLPPLLDNYRSPCWVEKTPPEFSYFEHTLYYQYYTHNTAHQPHRDWQDTYTTMNNLVQGRSESSRDDRGWRIRCFPYFFLIGFTKSGTCDLRRSLSKIPDFVHGMIKEPRFWNKVRLNAHKGAGVPATLSDYLDLYDWAAERIRVHTKLSIGKDGGIFHPGVLGDYDPQNAWLLPRWQSIHGNENETSPRYTTAHHLHSIRPQTKLIVLMRDPVQRTFSHYRSFQGSKPGVQLDAQIFHEDITKAVQLLMRCIKRNSVRECVFFKWGRLSKYIHALTVSLYDVYIRDWLDVFPRQQFLFLKSEDYFADRITTIQHVLDFLKIDYDMRKSEKQRLQELRAMNPSKKSHMFDKTKHMLTEFFRPYNKRLANLMEDDRFLWEDS